MHYPTCKRISHAVFWIGWLLLGWLSMQSLYGFSQVRLAAGLGISLNGLVPAIVAFCLLGCVLQLDLPASIAVATLAAAASLLLFQVQEPSLFVFALLTVCFVLRYRGYRFITVDNISSRQPFQISIRAWIAIVVACAVSLAVCNSDFVSRSTMEPFTRSISRTALMIMTGMIVLSPFSLRVRLICGFGLISLIGLATMQYRVKSGTASEFFWSQFAVDFSLLARDMAWAFLVFGWSLVLDVHVFRLPMAGTNTTKIEQDEISPLSALAVRTSRSFHKTNSSRSYLESWNRIACFLIPTVSMPLISCVALVTVEQVLERTMSYRAAKYQSLPIPFHVKGMQFEDKAPVE